jgi:hypothetical protein
MLTDATGENARMRYNNIHEYVSNGFCSSDLFRMLLGNYISCGQYREVYEYGLDNSKVIKVCNSVIPANIIEWTVWESVKDIPSFSKWFAPCYFISPEGRFLIQEKVEPIPEGYKFPKRIPAFFTDTQGTKNVGILNGRMVFVDYQDIIRGVDASMLQLVPYKPFDLKSK